MRQYVAYAKLITSTNRRRVYWRCLLKFQLEMNFFMERINLRFEISKVMIVFDGFSSSQLTLIHKVIELTKY